MAVRYDVPPAGAHTHQPGAVLRASREQLVGEAADRKSDFYSLGVMLFEMTTGRLPFAGGTAPGLMRQILLEPPPILSAVRPEVPERLTRLVSALLAKEPQGRPASARLIIEELTRCQRGERMPATRVLPPAAGLPAATARPTDMAVVQLLVRGRHLWNKRTEQSLRSALTCFQEVIDRDPMQGKAWIGIADTLNLLSNYGFAPPGDSLVRVLAAVGRAIELEGESADALRALALAAWQFDFDWEEAETLYRRAARGHRAVRGESGPFRPGGGPRPIVAHLTGDAGMVHPVRGSAGGGTCHPAPGLLPRQRVLPRLLVRRAGPHGAGASR